MTPPPAYPELHWTFFGVWAALGFAISAVVHALSYFSIAAQSSLPWFWALHIGALQHYIARWKGGKHPTASYYAAIRALMKIRAKVAKARARFSVTPMLI